MFDIMLIQSFRCLLFLNYHAVSNTAANMFLDMQNIGWKKRCAILVSAPSAFASSARQSTIIEGHLTIKESRVALAKILLFSRKSILF